MVGLDGIGSIFVGTTEIGSVHIGGEQIWPTTYECTLVPEAWTYGGQYLLSAIPAVGGYASPTRWVFTIADANTHQTLQTIYLSSLLTVQTIQEYINGEWVSPQNFSFSDNKWTADDRGTNGYGTSGNEAPQSASARQSRMIASYSTTYNNVQVSARYVGTMVQNGNNAVAGTAYYDDPTVTLGNYYDTEHMAPAYQVSTTLTAVADLITPYTFVDAVTGATNPATYNYVQSNVATTDDFTFDAPSWVTMGTPSSQGVTVTIHSRGTEYGSLYRDDSIVATLSGHSSVYGSASVYQSQNVYIDQQNRYTDAWAETYVTDDTISAETTTFTVYGLFHFEYRNQYSSLEWDNWSWTYESVTPVINSVYPSTGVQVSGNVVTIPENTGYSDIEYETSSTITYDGQTESGLIASVTQQGLAQYITFATPVITGFYYPDDDGYNIPASGGTVFPVIEFEQDYSINGVHSSGMTLYGYADDGTSSGTMSSGDISSDFTIHYYVGNSQSQNGSVSAGSRGTTPDASGATTIQIASNCYAYVTAKNFDSSASSRETVTQQANHEESTEEINNTYAISGLSFAWNSGNAKALSAGESGTLSWSSCKEYYYERTWYTSGAHSDGSTQYNRDITPEAIESSYWLSTSGYTVTASKQDKNSVDRSATVYAVYDGNTLDSVTVTQAMTVISYTLESSYSSGLTFTAAGGNEIVTFYGCTNYDNGDSPTRSFTTSVTVTYDGDVAGRISNGGSQGRTITASYLGTTPYDEVNTYYTYQWVSHSEATCTIPVYQGPNEPGDFGSVSFPAPSGTIAASGGSKTLSPTCSFTWTSGSSGTMGADGFDFDWVTKANDGDRSYSLSGNSATFGSLGTNTTSLVNSWLRATLKADSSKSATAAIQEEPNGPTNNHELTISWSNPVIIPGYGGSINVGIVTAKYKTQYDSGAWDSGDNVTPSTIAASIQISGSGFTKSYSSGNSYVTISAPYNPDSSSARDCDLTAYYGGESDTTSVTQKNCPFDTDYRETTEGGQRIRTAYILNTDDERHRYGYTKETSVAGVVDTTTGTAGPINAGSEQNMGAVPLVSGYTNTISVTVDTVEEYSGGSWVSHNVIRS